MRRAAEEQKYSVTEACRGLHISRAGYYQWRSGRASARTVENRRLAGLVKKIHSEHPDKGYRRIRDDLARYYGAPVNDKRALRICHSLGIRSTIKYARHGSYAVSAGMKPVIPPKKDRKEQRDYDKYLYKLRHLAENCFLTLKRWRDIATRSAKTSDAFIAAVHVRCIAIWAAIRA